MAMTLCAAGKHYYDSAVQSGCPYCGESAPSGSSHTAAIPAAPEERTQMLTADSHQLAVQSAKTQMLDNPAPAAESDSYHQSKHRKNKYKKLFHNEYLYLFFSNGIFHLYETAFISIIS